MFKVEPDHGRVKLSASVDRSVSRATAAEIAQQLLLCCVLSGDISDGPTALMSELESYIKQLKAYEQDNG
jgi:hypothetical protein